MRALKAWPGWDATSCHGRYSAVGFTCLGRPLVGAVSEGGIDARKMELEKNIFGCIVLSAAVIIRNWLTG